MAYDLIVGLALGAMSGYIAFQEWRIRRLEETVYTFPTVDELAKEVIKVKINPEDLPPEFKNAMDNMFGGGAGMKSNKEDVPSYMG